MKAILKYSLYRRSQPTNEVEANGYLPKGSVIDVEEVVQGKSIDKISSWYKASDGFYYWGGGIKERPPLETVPVRELAEVGDVKEETVFPWWLKALKVPEIWNQFNEKGKNAKVAVIDSGYNINNPEIHDGVVGTFLHPSLVGKTSINDNLGHGSYCASVIGARNRANMIGCAPECHLYISKMANGSSYDSNNMADAIEDAILNGVHIISISNGGEKFDRIETAIKKAIANNIIVVTAIGNNESATPQQGGDFPALYHECIAVGATDQLNKLALVTLINLKTEINAPGENIQGYFLKNIPEEFGSSTSIATAVVAGVCALIISRHKQLNKLYTADSVRKLIVDFFDPVVGNQSQKLISPMKVFNNIKIL